MRILGIDPGLHITGYGILDVVSYGRCDLVEAGCIKTLPRDTMDIRLHTLFIELDSIIKEFKPHVLSIENLYSHYNNPRTAIIMAHARGIPFLVANLNGLGVVEYSATKIKNSLTGYGRATKEQMQRMVMNTLGLKETPNPYDVTDALAAALCHANTISHSTGFEAQP